MAVQQPILWRRADLIRQSIVLACASLLSAACLTITLLIAALMRWDAGGMIIFLSVGCLVALIGSLGLFLWDGNRTLAALKLDLEDVLG